MECVAEEMTFISPSGEATTFPYRGPTHPSYGEWGKSPDNVRRLDNPFFLGGALIFPPKRPGWKRAHVKELSTLVSDNETEAHATYDALAEAAPHLDPAVWEELMHAVLLQAKGNVSKSV